MQTIRTYSKIWYKGYTKDRFLEYHDNLFRKELERVRETYVKKKKKLGEEFDLIHAKNLVFENHYNENDKITQEEYDKQIKAELYWFEWCFPSAAAAPSDLEKALLSSPMLNERALKCQERVRDSIMCIVFTWFVVVCLLAIFTLLFMFSCLVSRGWIFETCQRL